MLIFRNRWKVIIKKLGVQVATERIPIVSYSIALKMRHHWPPRLLEIIIVKKNVCPITFI
jgi:hypothetical protein